MSIKRERLSPEVVRSAALEAARALLLEQGPHAVTLTAVGKAIGKSHVTLLHHFGSAAGLQADLATSIAARCTQGMADAVAKVRRGRATPREVVDLVFDAFDKEGGAALGAWMVLSGHPEALNPILSVTRALVEQMGAGYQMEHTARNTLWLAYTAIGDSLLGGPLTSVLGLPREAGRQIAAAQLVIESARADPAG